VIYSFLSSLQLLPRRLSARHKRLGALVLSGILILTGYFSFAHFTRSVPHHSALAFASDEPTVGAPTHATVVLDRPDYLAVAEDETAPMWVRIEKVVPRPDGAYSYELEYTGLESGVFNLTDFLLKSPDERLSEPIVSVGVRSAIPSDAGEDMGELLPLPPANAFPYSKWLAASAMSWLGWGLWLLWARHRAQRAVQEAEMASQSEAAQAADEAPSTRRMADVLRPLVEKAADKTISSKEKALMEHILFVYWSNALELDHLDDAEQLRRILEHEEAGALMRAVEQWLYQPASDVTPEEITDKLEPYMDLDMNELPELAKIASGTLSAGKNLLVHA